MSSECIYSCIHPLWGGAGTCYAPDDGNPVCACDAGYASRDARGNASCVPRRVLAVTYFLVGTTSLLAAVITVWNINNQYRYLPVRIQSARKASIRLRALVSSSVYLLGFVSIGFVLAAGAGDAGYSDPGILQINYVVLTPAVMFGVAMIAGYWVECLPSQVLAPGSLAGMLRKASESSSAFVLFGLANGAPISALGLLSIFFQEWPEVVADLAIGAGATCAGGVILFVATQTSGAITQAMEKGSTNSRAFYAKARSNLRLQAVTLCSIAFVAVTASMAKQLTLAGRGTPIVAWTAQILCAHAGVVVFSLATRFETTSSASGGPSLAASAHSQGIGSSTVMRILSAAVAAHAAAHAVLREQGWRLSIRPPWFNENTEPVSEGTHDSNETAEGGTTPFDAAPKSESSARNPAHRHHTRKADTARVVPMHEDLAVPDIEKGFYRMRDEEWTIESATDVE